MRLIVLLSLLGIITGCAGLQPAPYQEPELGIYYDMFLEDAEELGVRVPDRSVTIVFDHLESPYAGFCDKKKISNVGNAHIKYRIRIDEDYWSRIDEGRKVALMYHEFGHCLLDRDHVEPSSIMEQTNIGNFLEHKLYYVMELFGLTEKVELQKSYKQSPKLTGIHNYGNCGTNSANHRNPEL